MWWVPWLVFVAVFLAIFVLNIVIVRYYNHRTESETFPTIIAVIAFSLSLLCSSLIPVDVYLVSMKEKPENFVGVGGAIQAIYYVLYSVIMVFTFIVVPFTYFWYEAKDVEKPGLGRRCWDAWKFTLGFLVIIIILVIVGLVVQIAPSKEGNLVWTEWVESALDVPNKGEGALLFTIACTTLVSFVFYLAYAAYGISALPIGLLKGRRNLDDEKRDYERSINKASDRRRLLDHEEGKEDDRAARAERSLTTRAARLEETANACCTKCFSVLRPFQVIFGILFMIVTLALVSSLFIGALDRVLSSFCHSPTCGYILNLPMIWNPVDQFLKLLARVYPLDFVALALIVLYFYFSALTGLSRIGIRIACLKLYSFKRRGTYPQGILIGASIMMLVVLALNMQTVILAPGYAYWGSQTWVNSTTPNVTFVNTTVPINASAPMDAGVPFFNSSAPTNGSLPIAAPLAVDGIELPCSLEGLSAGKCQMTELGQIVTKIMLRGAFFALVFYWVSWAFIAVWLIGLIVAACQKAESWVESYSDDEMEPE